MDRLGFRKAVLVAARHDGGGPDEARDGYKVWPRLGYDADIPEHMRFRLLEESKTAKSVLDLLESRERAAWWEEHGRSTAMEFDMSERSRSREVLDHQLAAKAARGELERAPLASLDGSSADVEAPAAWPPPGREPYCDPGDLGDLDELGRLVFGWDD